MLIGPEGHGIELPLFPYFCLKQKGQGHINLNLVQRLDVRDRILLISIRFIGYVWYANSQHPPPQRLQEICLSIAQLEGEGERDKGNRIILKKEKRLKALKRNSKNGSLNPV